MSATIYSVPKEIKKPDIFSDKDWMVEEEKYKKAVRAHIKSMGYKGKNSGEIIRFAVADGCAEYMVLRMRPLELVHLETGDSYEFPYVHLMTGKEVQRQLDMERRMAKLFSKKK